MRLELGSGDRPTHGFVHLDMRPDAPDLQLCGDATNLDQTHRCDGYHGPLPNEARWREIRATHLLEHFSHRRTVEILEHWSSYLKPGGSIYLEVPNLSGHVNAWKWGQSSDEQFVEYLFGEQDHDGNFHKTMFTERTLRDSLERAGFGRIQVRDLGLVFTAKGSRADG